MILGVNFYPKIVLAAVFFAFYIDIYIIMCYNKTEGA